MKYFNRYIFLTAMLGSLLTGVQIFGPAFLMLWLLNEVRVGGTIAAILVIAWLFKHM